MFYSVDPVYNPEIYNPLLTMLWVSTVVHDAINSSIQT